MRRDRYICLLWNREPLDLSRTRRAPHCLRLETVPAYRRLVHGGHSSSNRYWRPTADGSWLFYARLLVCYVGSGCTVRIYQSFMSVYCTSVRCVHGGSGVRICSERVLICGLPLSYDR